MKRINPNFRQALLNEEEANSFLDELFNNLLDQNDLNAESDAIPDLSILDR
jgi:hypothetical protein